jgi:hypothetical protein
MTARSRLPRGSEWGRGALAPRPTVEEMEQEKRRVIYAPTCLTHCYSRAARAGSPLHEHFQERCRLYDWNYTILRSPAPRPRSAPESKEGGGARPRCAPFANAYISHTRVSPLRVSAASRPVGDDAARFSFARADEAVAAHQRGSLP